MRYRESLESVRHKPSSEGVQDVGCDGGVGELHYESPAAGCVVVEQLRRGQQVALNLSRASELTARPSSRRMLVTASSPGFPKVNPT